MLPKDLLRAKRPSSTDSAFSAPRGSVGKLRPPSTGSPGRSTPLTSIPASIMNSQGGSSRSGSVLLEAKQARRRSPSSAPPRKASGSLVPSPSTPGMLDERVRVVVRCRPPTESDIGDAIVVSMDPSEREVYVAGQEAPWRVDTPVWSCGPAPALDGTLPTSQSDFYDLVGRPLLLHALEGYNSTLMTYGQTGSGKTYTMMGSGAHHIDCETPDSGITPRLCGELFRELETRTFTAPDGGRYSWEVSVRYVEVYCEKISDLLNNNAPVSVREVVTPQFATFAMVGARRLEVHNTEELLEALATGNKCRSTACTRWNEHSSRSHALFIIELTELLSFEEDDGQCVSAPTKSLNIRLVDLAGSERVCETGVQDQQLKEAKNINKSLFTLGMVIETLSDPKRRGMLPPYRESTLTKLLRDAFGGNSKTTMVCTVSPCESQRAHTIQTLHYASKAGNVLNKPRIAEDPSAVELRRTNEELVALREELADAVASGRRRDDIERQLREANSRLQREQAEARRRREETEKREAALALRLRELEEQQEAYEAQMELLEAQAEEARRGQREREAELRRAHEEAEAGALRRMQELQAQRDKSEAELKAKEDALRARQKHTKEKLKKLEAQSRERIDGLLSRQRDLEAELAAREAAAAEREAALRAKQREAEEQAEALEARARELEREWAGQAAAAAAAAAEREREMAARGAEAQRRLRETEEACEAKEEAMRRKWTDAERQAARLRVEAEAKQAALDRRVLELSRQAEAREAELQERLAAAEYEVRAREREAALRAEEAANLREETARQAQSRAEAADAEQQGAREALRRREERLRRREQNLQQQFGEIINMKQEWEREYRERSAAVDAAGEELRAQMRERAAALEAREDAARDAQDDCEARARAQEMELQRLRLELLGQRGELEAQAQRDRLAAVRLEEELSAALAKAKDDARLREDRLQRWEADLQARRREQEAGLGEREAAAERRERAAAEAAAAAAAKAAELDLMVARMREEQEAFLQRGREEEAARRRQHEERLAGLERRARELAEAEAALEDRSLTSSIAPTAASIIEEAALVHQQQHIMALEAAYRGAAAAEEVAARRFLLQRQILEARDCERAGVLAEGERRLQASRAELEALRAQQMQAAAEGEQLEAQVAFLKEELGGRQREAVAARVRTEANARAAQAAAEEVERLRQTAAAAEGRHREALTAARGELRARTDELEAALAAGRVRERWALAFLADCEARERATIEQTTGRAAFMLQLLEMSERKSTAKDLALLKWQGLCQQARAEGETRGPRTAEAAAAAAEREAAADKREAAVRAREEALAADRAALEEQRGAAEAAARERGAALEAQEAQIKAYLLALEADDRAHAARRQEEEQRLVDQSLDLARREAVLSAELLAARAMLLGQMEAQGREACAAREALEREGLWRRTHDAERRAVLQRALADGDRATLEAVIRSDGEGEGDFAAARAALLDEVERRRREWLAQQETAIQRYLLALESEDARRARLSSEGQAYFEEAERRLREAERQEAELAARTRRTELEAQAAEERQRAQAEELRRRESDLQRRLRALRGQRAEADSIADTTERTLLGMESDLRAVVSRNKETEGAIRAKDAEIQRQKLYYLDLSKMLAEREALLKREHEHRMDGKESATWLTKDLLDVNDSLKKQLKAWKHRFQVLRSADKVECDKCGWQNSKDSLVCRCCGSEQLADLGNITVCS